jgi:hypothetical protein
MQEESLKEYEQIRSEMLVLKDCVTKYMGYVLGGTGVAVFGFTAIEATGFSLAWSAMLLSLAISLVLVILFYKFTSHNRYAGYSKVLDAEVFVDAMENPKRLLHQSPKLIVAWEMCIERLRVSDMKDSEYLANMLDQVNIHFEHEHDKDRLKFLLRAYSGRHPPIDKLSHLWGIGRLLAALFGHVRTNSWAFPPYVASVFFVITFA